MWFEKLFTGVLRVLTPLGPRYIKPSFAQRIYLLWVFRHFQILPLQVLTGGQRRVIDALCVEPRFVSLTEARRRGRSRSLEPWNAVRRSRQNLRSRRRQPGSRTRCRRSPRICQSPSTGRNLKRRASEASIYRLAVSNASHAATPPRLHRRWCLSNPLCYIR